LSDRHATCIAIRAASTEAEVIAQVRKYLSSLDAAKMALMPPTLLAVGVDHAKEIAQGALELASREVAEADPSTGEFLRDAATVLSTAAMRLAMLAMGAHSDGS